MGLKNKFVNKKEEDRTTASVGRRIPVELDVYNNSALMVHGG
jgi:hypothetical protein